MTANPFRINWPTRKEVEQELLPLVKPNPASDSEREKLITDLTCLVLAYKSLDMADWERECACQILVFRNRIIQAVDLLSGFDNGDSELETIIESLRKILEKYPDLKPAKRRRGAPRNIEGESCARQCREFLQAREKHAGTGDDGCASQLASAVWNLAMRYENGKKQSAASMSKLAKREMERERDKKKRDKQLRWGDKKL